MNIANLVISMVVLADPTTARVPPAPHPAAFDFKLPVNLSQEMVFTVSNLGCPLVDGVGCGHLLAPALAQIDGLEGVLRSYTNWAGTALRVSVSPGADRDRVAAAVKTHLTNVRYAPKALTEEMLAESLKSEDWRSVERVFELTSYEYHTFSRQQIGDFADEQGLDQSKKERLVAIVDRIWEKVAADMGVPGVAAEEYSHYWKMRLEKLVDKFSEDATEILSREQIAELLKKHGPRTK